MSFINQSEHCLALVDCNNFYVSCERVFNPKLIGKPVVVLSSNDGIIIARSKEAKKIGIPMGAPVFEYKDILRNYNVIQLSSNFALYGDMSNRVMHTLAQFTPDMHVYSIDEAFLMIEAKNSINYCKNIQRVVQMHTGIEISIGIGPTMTLAKVANDIAKKDSSQKNLFSLQLPEWRERTLQTLPVEEVWGIGRNLSDFLHRKNIHTAGEFKDADDSWIKKNLSIVGLRMAWELRGISCLFPDDLPSPKKSITCSRSFSTPLTDLDELYEAIATFTSRAAEKLREQASLASHFQVFLMTNKHHDSYYGNQTHILLPQPTDYTPTLIEFAKEGLKRIFHSGLIYKKTGITLNGLVPKNSYQLDLFSQKSEHQEKERSLMQIIDQLNSHYGKNIIKTAAEGIEQPWKSKKETCSPHYTTNWNELLLI